AAPQQPAAAGASGGDTGEGKLPTVDELLQRIQSDRQRSSGGGPATAGGGIGADKPFGNSLADPLSDPLGAPPFSGSGSPSSSPSASGGGPTGGYQAAPTYNDDPLSSGRDSYGSYGGATGGQPTTGAAGGAGGSAGEQGRYGDFGGGYGNDPLTSRDTGPRPAGAFDPNATQAYGSGYESSGNGSYNPSYGSGGQEQNPPQQDDWQSHRDYRR
ncbi:hypothetical protein DZF91_14205, partial [Actinomadura logoneensis]